MDKDLIDDLLGAPEGLLYFLFVYRLRRKGLRLIGLALYFLNQLYFCE